MGHRVDPNCAVNSENHLEKEILAPWLRLHDRSLSLSIPLHTLTLTVSPLSLSLSRASLSSRFILLLGFRVWSSEFRVLANPNEKSARLWCIPTVESSPAGECLLGPLHGPGPGPFLWVGVRDTASVAATS